MICVDYLCDKCKHQHTELIDGWIPSCDAFPNGIPDDFDNKKADELVECKNGIGYDPIEE